MNQSEQNFSNILYILYDKLGLRYLWEKFHQPKNKKGERPPSTFLVWIISVYIGLFSLTTIRYEQSVSRLENRLSNISYLVESENWKIFFSKIPKLQRSLVPYAPLFTSPSSLIYSLFPFKDTYDMEVINELQDLIFSKKTELSEMRLNKLILAEIETIKGKLVMTPLKWDIGNQRNFLNSNFNYSSLEEVEFQKVDFSNSTFEGANLKKGDLKYCNLSNSSFLKSNLTFVDLRFAKLIEANMQQANLINADLKGAILLGANLSNVLTLGSAKIDNVWYNSYPIKLNDDENTYKTIENICLAQMEDTDCYKFARGFPVNKTIPATLFPKEFNPESFNMIDINKFIVK